MPRTTGLSLKVLRMFEHRMGVAMTTEDIAAEAGIESRQVTNAVRALRGAGYEIMSPGRNVYLFTGKLNGRGLIFGQRASSPSAPSSPAAPSAPSAPSVTGQMFEAVGTTKAGNFIIRSEDGALFVAKPLDL